MWQLAPIRGQPPKVAPNDRIAAGDADRPLAERRGDERNRESVIGNANRHGVSADRRGQGLAVEAALSDIREAPVLVVVITGSPLAIASATTYPKPSVIDGCTSTLASPNTFA